MPASEVVDAKGSFVGIGCDSDTFARLHQFFRLPGAVAPEISK
jgi:hypothetical protein